MDGMKLFTTDGIGDLLGTGGKTAGRWNVAGNVGEARFKIADSAQVCAVQARHRILPSLAQERAFG